MEELFILGNYYTIETEIGTCHFVTVKDYPKLMKYVQLLYLEKEDVLKSIKNEYKSFFSDLSLVDIINHFNEGVFNLKQLFEELFQFIFNEDVFYKIKTDDELNYYRNMIVQMNHIRYEKPNPNPEIEYYNKLERIMKEKNGEVITLKSLITSVWLYTNPFELTIYQLYALFNRINMFKTYDTTSLFKTIDNKTDIVAWYKDFDINKNDSNLTNNDKDYINNHMSRLPINNK